MHLFYLLGYATFYTWGIAGQFLNFIADKDIWQPSQLYEIGTATFDETVIIAISKEIDIKIL